MKIYNSLEGIDHVKKTVVALGNFDGVHKGHQELIARTVKAAEAAEMKSAVFTFSNHPRNLTGKGPFVKSILYNEEKADIIKSLGIDILFSVPFTKDILNMRAESFIDELLIKKIGMQEAYCGFNYRFGYKAEGNAEVLIHEGMKKGFGIHVLEPFSIDGQLVSSTMIRKCIEEGMVDRCFKYLGRYYSIGGEVVIGNKLGKKLGFPTSNLIIDESMVSPPNGVYITYCTYEGKRYPGVTNVGRKPTVGEFEKNVETHIFNFNKELYGKRIKVEFLKRTRPEKKFDTIEELSKQITEDCIAARAFHRAFDNEDTY